MIAIQNYVQLIAIALFFGVLISKWILPKLQKSRVLQSGVILLIAATFMYIQIDGATLAMCLRGLIGNLSIPSLLLIGLATLSIVADTRIYCKFTLLQLGGMVLLGGILYLTTFGIIPFDLYYYGYDYVYIATALFIYAVFSFKKTIVPAVAAIAIMIAFKIELLGSRNIFDYIIDLPLWLVCCWQLAVGGWRLVIRDKGERLNVNGEMASSEIAGSEKLMVKSE
ncbi:MAG: hypothetical protein WCP79_09135 [Bacillota bacterium]